MSAETPAIAPARAGRPLSRKRAARRALRRSAIVVLVLVPLALLALKLSGLPFAAGLREWLSLEGRATVFEARVAHVLLVPLGALLAVFFRLTLGIRVLGPFRSVLLAIAFQVTGVPAGLVFLALVLAAVVAVAPLLRRMRLPYYARLSATLSVVALVIALALLLGRGFGWVALTRAAFFPIVVLSLAADGFARTLRREGVPRALWRGATTAGLGVLITGLAAVPGFEALLLRHPELLLVEVGLMLAITEFAGFRLLAALDPPRRRRRRHRRRRPARRGERPAQAPIPDTLTGPAPATETRTA